jgi:hypothetical protein
VKMHFFNTKSLKTSELPSTYNINISIGVADFTEASENTGMAGRISTK